MDAGVDPAPVSTYVSFVLTLPLYFNPAPGQVQGDRIPQEWIDDVEDMIDLKWGGSAVDEQYRRLGFRRSNITVQEGIGSSVYVDPDGTVRRYREPEWRFTVDVKMSEGAEAWDWFAEQCSQWARRFDQREIYLKLQGLGGILTYRFAPPGEPWEIKYANPFRP